MTKSVSTFFLLLIVSFCTAKISSNYNNKDGNTPHRHDYDNQQNNNKKKSLLNHRRFLRREKETTSDSSFIISPRIVGGQDANASMYPHFVRWDIGCGATLIHPDILLTAGHCSVSYDWNTSVWIGPQEDRSEGIPRSVIGASRHPYYNDFTLNYDYMVLVLNKPAPASLEFAPLNNNSNHPIIEGTLLTAIGFGVNDTTASSSSFGLGTFNLQEVTLPYVTHERCTELYGGSVIEEDTMFCAGGGLDGEDAASTKDTCQGDSGGPIFDQNGVQVGITSWGKDCAEVGFPGVYSRVSFVYDWIQQQICLNTNVLPLPSSCTGPRFELKIQITHDDYPYEVGWNIKDHQDEIITMVPFGTVVMTSTPGVSTRTLNLSPGNYTFELMDAAGDGLCCMYGNGQVSLSDGVGNAIEHDGEFTYIHRVHFEMTDSGDIRELLQTFTNVSFITVATDYLNSLNYHAIRIDIMYDSFPEEVSWMLIDQTTGELIHLVPYNSILYPGLQSVTIIVPDGEFWFLLLDAEFDGICCTFGDGWMTIHEVGMITGEEESEIFTHGGSFTGRVEHFFTLGSS